MSDVFSITKKIAMYLLFMGSVFLFPNFSKAQQIDSIGAFVDTSRIVDYYIPALLKGKNPTLFSSEVVKEKVFPDGCYYTMERYYWDTVYNDNGTEIYDHINFLNITTFNSDFQNTGSTLYPIINLDELGYEWQFKEVKLITKKIFDNDDDLEFVVSYKNGSNSSSITKNVIVDSDGRIIKDLGKVECNIKIYDNKFHILIPEHGGIHNGYDNNGYEDYLRYEYEILITKIYRIEGVEPDYSTLIISE